MSGVDSDDVETRVLEALRAVIDPELGLNVVDLGLVYGLDIENSHVRVQLTMTCLHVHWASKSSPTPRIAC